MAGSSSLSLSLSSSSLSRLFPGGFIPSSRPSAAAHCAHPFSAEQRLQGTDPCPNTGPTATTADKEARSFDQISMKNPDPLILGYEREGGRGGKGGGYYIVSIISGVFYVYSSHRSNFLGTVRDSGNRKTPWVAPL